MRYLIYSFIVFLSIASVPLLQADTIHLKNGKRFDGIVIEEGDHQIIFDVVIGADKMRMFFPRHEVDRIDRGSAEERGILEREMLKEQAGREKLEQEMREQGLILHRGEWITEEERQRAEEARKEEATKPRRSQVKRPLAPSFELPDLDGNIHTMNQYHGQIILLYFFGTSSRPSTYQIPTLRRAYNRYRGRDVTLLGISLDQDKKKVENFVKARDIDFPILYDGKAWDSPVVKQYGIKRVPSTFIIDRAGYIRASGVFGKNIKKEIDKLLAQ